ncbi:hypothetical protein ABMY20_15405 [Tenacibaculum sp. SSH1-16]|uniref:hypothetical protein n=1 Tax=Tenacibaculum sp. SSH1-16 TaxID=3136667 RepID=UPI0032C45954
MGYKIKTVDGELKEYAFDIGGVLALRNFKAVTNGNRLIIESHEKANFTILDALVNEVEIDGIVYDDPTAAQEALQRLVFNPLVPVILPQALRDLIITSLQPNSIADNLTTNDSSKTLSAKQGVVLKELIDAVNQILTSDDTSLDELQEIVSYIKQNKTDLQNLSISNIAGLIDALASKITLNPTGDENKYFNEKGIAVPIVIPEQVQSDFNQEDNTKPDYIKGYPLSVLNHNSAVAFETKTLQFDKNFEFNNSEKEVKLITENFRTLSYKKSPVSSISTGNVNINTTKTNQVSLGLVFSSKQFHVLQLIYLSRNDFGFSGVYPVKLVKKIYLVGKNAKFDNSSEILLLTEVTENQSRINDSKEHFKIHNVDFYTDSSSSVNNVHYSKISFLEKKYNEGGVEIESISKSYYVRSLNYSGSLGDMLIENVDFAIKLETTIEFTDLNNSENNNVVFNSFLELKTLINEKI